MVARTPDVSGSFKRYPVPRLLFYLLKKRFLGLMEVREPDGSGGSIYFRDGLPSYSDLSSSRDVLGRVLLEWGLISEEDYNQSLELLAAGTRLQGQILLELGAIDQEGLVVGLRLQLQRKLTRLFSLEEATFKLCSCEHPHGLGESETLVQVDPLWVIHHGVRNGFSTPRMELELGKLAGYKLQLRPGFERLQPRFGFNAEELALVTLLTRSSLPVTKILHVSNLGPLETRMLIYSLWVTEALIVTGAEDQPVVVRSDSGAFSGPGPLTLAGSKPVGRSDPPPSEHQAEAERSGGGLLPIMTPHSERGDPPPSIILPPANADEAPLVILGGRPLLDPEQDSLETSGWLQQPDAAAAKLSATTPTEQPPDLPPTAEPQGRRPAPASAAGSNGGAPEKKRPPPARGVGSNRGAPEARRSTPARGVGSDGAAAKELAALIETTFLQIESQDHFQVLGLEQGASLQQVREAYFQQAKRFHPDRCAALGLAALSAKAEAIFRRVGEAHTVLCNPTSREEYERQNQEGAITQEQAQAALKAEMAYQKGVLLHRKKHYAEAERQFVQASKLDPEEGEYLAWVAWCRFFDPLTDRANDLDTLRMKLDQAVALSPRNATCHYFLGEIQLAAGNERKARQCFLQTVELKKDHIEAQRQLRLMQLRQDKRTSKSSGLFGRLRKK